MPVGYWFVQRFRKRGKAEAEVPCADCRETVEKVQGVQER